MFYWKRLAPGIYQARRDGKVVAVCERTKDHGEPEWEIVSLDGTDLGKGKSVRRFCTLGDARFCYGRAYRIANEAAA